MKILMTADIHADIGYSRPKKERMYYIEQLFEDIVALSEEHNVGHLYILGDLWTPKYEIKREIIKPLHSILNKTTCQITYLTGNHDYHNKFMYDLFPGRLVDKVEIREQDHGVTFIFLPWVPDPLPEIEYIKNAIKGINSDYYLFTHYPLKEGRPSLDQKINVPLSIKDLHSELFNAVFIGDYHEHQIINENIVYLGSPFPLDYNAVEGNHFVWLFDTKEQEITELELPSRYPQFKQYYFKHKAVQKIEEYYPANYTRITCRDSLTKE
jgi:DNA repair exonuclease SbcCD nuclease subunit